MKILKFESSFIELVWGTEDWLISAHENGMSKVKGTNLTLAEIYENQRELFGNIELEKFPLLMKVIDAKDPLSIQVHPDDTYAKEHENSLGKTECWYILDAKDTDLIIGQKAKNREELSEAIQNNKIEEYLNFEEINKDDFFFIPAGTVHAIRKNTKILEIQQSSDITYRLYDYNRKGVDGKPRELHVEKSLDVINYDYTYKKQKLETINGVTKLVESPFFNVYKFDIQDEFRVQNNSPFIMGYALDGIYEINGENVVAGEAFLIPSGIDLEIKGTGQIIISCL